MKNLVHTPKLYENVAAGVRGDLAWQECLQTLWHVEAAMSMCTPCDDTALKHAMMPITCHCVLAALQQTPWTRSWCVLGVERLRVRSTRIPRNARVAGRTLSPQGLVHHGGHSPVRIHGTGCRLLSTMVYCARGGDQSRITPTNPAGNGPQCRDPSCGLHASAREHVIPGTTHT